MKATRGFAALGAALGLTLSLLGAGTAAAAQPSKLSVPELRRLVLSLPAISAATRTGFAAQSSGVGCTDSRNSPNPNYCIHGDLRSDQASAAGAAWATNLGVLSFRTAAAARKYIASAGSLRPEVLSSSKTLVIAFNPQSMIAVGTSMQPGPEVTALQAVGPNAIWTSCADPTGQTSVADLASCAKSLAAAQAKKLP